MPAKKNSWLVKSEPTTYGIDHLKKDKRTAWTGVRNYQARNFMREMAVGDLVLFYHSSADVVGVAGMARVMKAAYPDPTQFEKKSHYYDPKSTREKPRWDVVEVAFVKKFPEIIPLGALREHPKLSGLKILQPGSRLSVTPVTAEQFSVIEKLGSV